MILRTIAWLLPLPLRNLALRVRERARLGRVPDQACDPARLRELDPTSLARFLADPRLMAEWPAVEAEMRVLEITDRAGGVNPGDRRALYVLIRLLRPARVLEIGTHIGASTAHLGAALRANQAAGGPPVDLTTVDVMDVNDLGTRPWLGFGSAISPIEIMRRLGVDRDVRFVVRPSLAFLRESPDSYDFIFLDGDHSAATVYRELPTALARLSDGGVIMLHDYFPDGRPLWPGDAVIPGPHLAVRRLVKATPQLRVLPLGVLPWPTKLGRSVTSLALVTRQS